MSVSRRSFIKSGSLSALFAGVIFKSGDFAWGQKMRQSHSDLDFPIPDRARQDSLFYYQRAAFEPHIGGSFMARDARGKSIELKLVRIRQYTPPLNSRITTAKARDTDCFSLLFRAPRSLPEFSSTHGIEHAALGKFDLFLNRSEELGQISYEAIVNHLL